MAILLGISLGLLYNWVIHPANNIVIEPEMLRIDYKTDFVLMVSEVFLQNNDLEYVLERLSVLNESSPLETTLQALVFAQEIGYSQDDLGKMQNLLTALQAYSLMKDSQLP
ncbi:MAG TPA: hypothetical protein VLM80_10705 [Anaerolineales bacterium]|nr:hypothetical protein [Anaerolineales bacterium]